MADNNTPSLYDKILAKFPAPFAFLQRVISADSPERASALLAVIAGSTLCLGYMTLLIALVYGKELLTAFITVNAALVSLATFSKVDRTDSTSTKIVDNIPVVETKQVDKKQDDKKQDEQPG